MFGIGSLPITWKVYEQVDIGSRIRIRSTERIRPECIVFKLHREFFWGCKGIQDSVGRENQGIARENVAHDVSDSKARDWDQLCRCRVPDFGIHDNFIPFTAILRSSL
jgi:hypothetical protein